jgi:trk system potassium uptake protein TrkH
MVVMFFGGMAGSTSGGAKLDRFVVLVKNCKNELYKVLHPNSVTAVWVDGKAMPQARINKVTAFLSIYVIIIFVVAIFLTAFDIPLFDALFSSMSVISNVGLGYGVTGADGSWALLPDAAKWILSLEMLIGRLELFTVLVVFSRSFWVKD